MTADAAVSPNDITEQEVADWNAAKRPFDPTSAQQALRTTYAAHREESAAAKTAVPVPSGQKYSDGLCREFSPFSP